MASKEPKLSGGEETTSNTRLPRNQNSPSNEKLDKEVLVRKIAFAASSLTRRDLYSLTLLTFCVDFSANQKRGSLINKRFAKVHGMGVTFDKRQTLENHVKTFNASGSDIDSISFPNKFYFAMSDSASLSPSI